jgi:hypothetical protein
MPSTSSSAAPAGSMPVAGSPGLFNCPKGVLPASNPLLHGGTVAAGAPSQISNYRVPQYDAPSPSYVIDGVNYWWRQSYIPPSAGPEGSIPVGGSPGLFNCAAGVLPASDPLLHGGTVAAGAPSQISNYRVPQYDAPGPSYVINGVNYWWRESYSAPVVPPPPVTTTNNQWEFHFRNFDNEPHYFGAYHMGCGGAPWKMGRPNCWSCQPANNPGGGQGSVYVPADFVVHFGAWLQVIVDALKEVEDVAMAIVSEGEDEDAWVEAASDAFDLSQDIIKAQAASSGAELATLMANSQQALASSAQAIGQTPETIMQIAQSMGLGTSGWGFIAGDTYQKTITSDSDINEGYGWSLLQAPQINTPIAYLCNHAFINQGHLILYWNSQNINGFWTPHNE